MLALLLKIPEVRPQALAKLGVFLASDGNTKSPESEIPWATLLSAKKYSGNDDRYGVTIRIEQLYSEPSGECKPLPAARLQGLWDALGLFPAIEIATRDSLPQAMNSETVLLADAVAEAEKACIIRAVTKCYGRKAEAAALLGISRKQLWEKMKAYGLESDGTST